MNRPLNNHGAVHPATLPTPPTPRRDRAARLEKRPPRILIDDFERLLTEFSDHIRAGRKLKVTDPKHDALVRMGLRGFSLTSRTFKWHAPQFLYLKRRARLHYESMGDGPLLFFCLAAGYALGLAEEDQLTKQEFKAAEQHLDSVIRLNIPRLKEALIEGMTR